MIPVKLESTLPEPVQELICREQHSPPSTIQGWLSRQHIRAPLHGEDDTGIIKYEGNIVICAGRIVSIDGKSTRLYPPEVTRGNCHQGKTAISWCRSA